jgi:ketosteroid isomerase-like protein
MKIVIFKTVFLTLLLLQIGFSQNDQQQILSVLNIQIESWNKGDLDAYMEGYWKSDELVFTSSGKITKGWKQTLDKYKKSYDTKDKMGRLKFSDLEVKKLSENSAYVLGKWELRRKTDNPKGVFTLIFKKMNEGWRIVHDHTSVFDEKK